MTLIWKIILKLCSVGMFGILVNNPVYGNDGTVHWSYGSQAEWPGECQTGTKQSPVVISNAAASPTHLSVAFKHFVNKLPVIVTSNGHTVEITVDKNAKIPSVTLDPKSTYRWTYRTDNWHFHWQSEHIINGNRYPLEMHIVNYAEQYGNVSEALKHEYGVAVIAVMFKVVSCAHCGLPKPLIDAINSLSNQSLHTEDKRVLNVKALLPKSKKFFRYIGSLTTPPCTENIIWSVFASPIPITQSQLNVFKLVKDDKGARLLQNFRSVQSINSRSIFTN